MTRPTFKQACARYPHRFTMTHAPAWAAKPRPDGTFYAPGYASCREWYENTAFPGERGYPFGRGETQCYSTGHTWPLGQSLPAPFKARSV